jgi:two-component system chemotaxis sensor kinase CheA
VAFARRCAYRVPEDLDLVVTMGFRFLAMLVRKKVGTNLGGIDLPGFIEQIDSVLADSSAEAAELPSLAAPPPPSRAERISPQMRLHLAAAATDVYLEHLNARGHSRQRLREVWLALTQQVAELAAVPLGPQLRRHAQAARELARDLDKPVEVYTEVIELDLRPDAAQAVDVVVLHLLRNAIDHGLESATGRREAGKRATGCVVVRARADSDELLIEVEDDGGGVDFSRVRRRGAELGLLAHDDDAGEARLLELLFQPGFSTAAEVSELSGRGIGLDAARAAVERAGGSLSLRSRAGRGTQALVRIQRASGRVPVHHFRAAGHEQRLAIPACWSFSLAPSDEAAIDPLAALKLAPDGDPARTVTLRLRAPDGSALHLLAASPVLSGLAERICPTDELHPVEVVRLDRMEALLLRPQLLGC